MIDAVLKGRRHGAVALHEANAAKSRCFGELQTLFSRHDVLVSPTLSAPPLSIDLDLGGDIEIAGVAAGTVRGAWYPYAFPTSLTGHPARSMPCHTSSRGLPIGLQLVGRWHDDLCLLGIAALLEVQLAAVPTSRSQPRSRAWNLRRDAARPCKHG